MSSSPASPPPPAHVPFIDQVRHDLSLNVSEHERSFSTIGGAGLIGFAVTQPSWPRWALLILGAALLKRGLTGQCDIYRQLQIDTRHPQPRSTASQPQP